MDATVSLSGNQRSALLDLLKNLCAIFWGPDREKCREMLLHDYFRPFDILEPFLVSEPPGALKKIKDLIQSFPDEKVLFAHLEQTYVSLFVNARGGIAASLYQSCYADPKEPQRENSLMGEPAVMMKERFASKGLALDSGLHEPPDHLAIELEYLYFLLQKGWAENDAAHLSEAAAFVETELLVWVPRFEERLREASAGAFYAQVASILVAALRLLENSH